MSKLKEYHIASLTAKVWEPEIIADAPVAILLHGWTGDESSMWVFGSRLDQHWLVIAPRAPFPTTDPGLGGYSWVDQSVTHWPTYQDFFIGMNYLTKFIDHLPETFPGAQFSRLNMVGFSQGAAMAYVYTGANTHKVKRLAFLSGFIPDGNEGFVNPEEFNSLELFIGHGELDDVVPVKRARDIGEQFEGFCKSLVFCVSKVGHRLGSDCFNAFQKFMID